MAKALLKSNSVICSELYCMIRSHCMKETLSYTLNSAVRIKQGRDQGCGQDNGGAHKLQTLICLYLFDSSIRFLDISVRTKAVD